MHAELAETTSPIRATIVPGQVVGRYGPKLGAVGWARTYAGNEEIFAEGDRPHLFYKVLTGAVRVLTFLSDGRRHIGAFHLPGDIFGIELGERHRFSAEAVSDTTVVSFPRHRLEASDPANGSLSDQLVSAMMRSLDRAQSHMLLLGRKHAAEKVASFLLDMSQRLGDEAVLHLPMSRTDIADHLGLTIETVSRSFTRLERQGIIELPAHRRSIVLRKKARLQRLAGEHSDASPMKDA